MPYRGMRDDLAALEQQNLLERITREVDYSWEDACLAKWMYQALPVEQRFGLYFQNVKGSTILVVTGARSHTKKALRSRSSRKFINLIKQSELGEGHEHHQTAGHFTPSDWRAISSADSLC